MTIERRRPLPAGRYWLDVFPANARQWELWTSSMQKMDPPRVQILTTEHFDGVDGAPPHDFVLFETASENVAYHAAGLPFPSVADSTIQTSEDTVTKPPPPPSVLEQLEQTASSLGSSAKVGVGIGVAAVVAIAGLTLLKRR